MKLKQLFFTCIVLVFSSCNSQEVNFQIDEYSWQADFKFLKKKVEKIVPSYQNSENKKAFNQAYEDISSSQIGKSKEEIVYSFQKLLNTLNDEGCNVPLFQKGIAFEVLPIKTYWFNNGLFVLDTSLEYKDVKGEQIVKINGISVDEMYQSLKSLLNADNDYYRKYLFQTYGLMPSVLKAVGFGENEKEVMLEFASGNKRKIKSSSIDEFAKLNRRLPNDEVFSETNKNHKGENYWSEKLPKSNTLFVQIQRVENQNKGGSFASFINDIKSSIETKKVDKIIIDLRYGGGGNGFKLKNFTDLLKDSETINKKGNLFILTSKATRGTLLELTSILKLTTKCIIIGEPTAEGANTVGDTKYITLPNSGIKISLTHTFWPTSWQQDINTYIAPDVEVAYNYSHKRKNQDPWLDVVCNYKVNETRQPISSDLQKQLIGTYKINGRKISIESIDGRLYLKMRRKMRSFFEIHTELYFDSEGIIATDIQDVTLIYSKNSSKSIVLQTLQWKNLNFNIDAY